jgi:hypothetical protein
VILLGDSLQSVVRNPPDLSGAEQEIKVADQLPALFLLSWRPGRFVLPAAGRKTDKVSAYGAKPLSSWRKAEQEQEKEYEHEWK